MIALVGRVIDGVLARLTDLPGTALVIVAGVGAFVGTIGIWWALSVAHAVFGHTDPTSGLWVASVQAWEPSAAMIAMISAWGVIAAAQYASKRFSDRGLAAAKATGVVPPDPATVTTTTTETKT